MLLPDEDGGLWVGRYLGGLDYFDPEAGTFTHYGHTLNPAFSRDHDTIRDIMEDTAGRLWIGASRGLGLFDRNTGTINYLQHDANDPTSLSPHAVKAIYQDASGLIWVGTFGGGVNTVAPDLAKFTYYVLPAMTTDNSSTRTINALETSRSGDVWVGTNTGMLFRFDRKTKSFTSSRLMHDGYSVNGIIALHEDRTGALWISISSQGVARFDPVAEAFTFYHRDPEDPGSLRGNYATTIHEDRTGRLWIGTSDGGLNRYDPQREAFTHYRQVPGEVPNGEPGMDFTNAFVEDSDGSIWIGTWLSGLIRFDPKTETSTYYRNDIQNPRSLGGNMVNAVHIDRAGRLWVGLYGQGLARFDRATKTFIHYQEKDGLANNYVFAILEDEQGALWLSTNQGLSRFDPITESFHNYDLEGLQRSDDHTKRAAHRGGDGAFFFSEGDRLVTFFPDQMSDNTYVPPVVITALERTNADSLSGTPFVDRTLYLKNQIELSYKDLILTFELAALSYYQNEKNRYAFQLEGFSDRWIELGTQRRLTFTNLNPGSYTLAVRGSNNDGVWSEERRLGIYIIPPWWRTGWAYFGYLVLLGALGLGLARNRLNRMRLRNRLEVEQVRAESLRELDKAKSRFFANVSHEFRTPLTLILGPLEDLYDSVMGQLDDTAREHIGLAISNSRRLLRLVNQLLDVSRLETGRLQLQARRLDLGGFAVRIGGAFQSLAERKQMAFHIEVPDAPCWCYLDPEQMEKVLTNLLGNAFKFTEAGGTIQLIVSTDAESSKEGMAYVRVADTGSGIDAAHLPHLFERFYQVDASSTRRQSGTGIGLALVDRLVSLHHGEVTVESEVGLGSTFIVMLPLGRRHLTDEELAFPDGDAVPEIPWPYEEPLWDSQMYLDPISLVAASDDLSVPALLPDEDQTTLLIVDDDADIRAYMRRHLGQHYRIVEAANGREALASAQHHIPDLIISDVMMPEMDGYALCQALKQDPELDFIPVILLTAKASTESKIEGLEEGADDYLTKPFNVRELVARVENLIASRQRLKARFMGQATATSAHQSAGGAPDEAPFLAQVQTVIEAHLGEDSFGVDDLARALGLSRATLYRRLEGLMDQSPMDWIWQLRLEQAAILLSQGAGSVSEVAYGVGFKSIAHFSNRFHDHFGMSPSAYGLAHRDQKAS